MFKKTIWKLIKRVNIYSQQLNFWLNNGRLHNWRSRKPQLKFHSIDAVHFSESPFYRKIGQISYTAVCQVEFRNGHQKGLSENYLPVITNRHFTLNTWRLVFLKVHHENVRELEQQVVLKFQQNIGRCKFNKLHFLCSYLLRWQKSKWQQTEISKKEFWMPFRFFSPVFWDYYFSF